MPADVVKAACDRYLRNGKTTNRPEILGDPDFDIVLQYQWHCAGLVNYYLLAQNVANFGRLRYIMETSLLKTLANKHRKSVAFMWRKYKNTVRTPDGPRRCIKVVIERPEKQPLTAVFGGLSLRRQVKAVLKTTCPSVGRAARRSSNVSWRTRARYATRPTRSRCTTFESFRTCKRWGARRCPTGQRS